MQAAQKGGGGVNASQYHRQGHRTLGNGPADNVHVCISMFAREGVYAGCGEHCSIGGRFDCGVFSVITVWSLPYYYFSKIIDLGSWTRKVYDRDDGNEK